MAETYKNLCIVLLTRSRLEIFDIIQKKVFPFNIPPAIFRDLEILNKNELEAQLSLFINFHKIRPGPLLIILASEIYYELEFADTNETAIESKINNFLFYLPFEEDIHKIYKQIKGFYLVAVNKDIVETMKYIFTRLGFYIEGIVPTGITGINVKTIDIPSADYLVAKLREIKNQSIVSVESRFKEKKVEEKRVLGINRVFLLLSVFAVLLIFLLLMLYQQTIANNKRKTGRSYLTRYFRHSSVEYIPA